MVNYGGMGGIEGGRALNPDDKFEAAVERWLGPAMREDECLCAEMWCAVANQDWRHDNGDTAGYSFRAAGDLVAGVVGRGNYMDWYCSGPDGEVSERVREALAQGGWHPV